jgi:hypothetical protein
LPNGADSAENHRSFGVRRILAEELPPHVIEGMMDNTYARNASNLVALFAALAAYACGGAAVPHDQMTAAEASVSAAEAGGAADVPKAALHVKKAKDQIAEAKKQIEQGENEMAEWALQRASADATLALSLAREESLKAEAAKAVAEVEELKAKARK